MRLLDGLEVVNRDKRLRVARAILYLAQGKDHNPVSGCGHVAAVWLQYAAWEKAPLGAAQQSSFLTWSCVQGFEGISPLTSASLWPSPGVFGDCDNEDDVLHWSRHNSFLLYRLGTFTAFLELLNMEIE